jgi:hypothetical protein
MIKKLIEAGNKLIFSGSTSRSPISFSIVNTEANGKRIKFSTGLLNQLGNPKDIGMVVNEDNTGILVYASENNLHVGKGNIIYNASIVNKLTETFGLDFSSHTSHSFSNISVKTDPDDKITYAEIILAE